MGLGGIVLVSLFSVGMGARGVRRFVRFVRL
jgi:hypothetical protein